MHLLLASIHSSQKDEYQGLFRPNTQVTIKFIFTLQRLSRKQFYSRVLSMGHHSESILSLISFVFLCVCVCVCVQTLICPGVNQRVGETKCAIFLYSFFSCPHSFLTIRAGQKWILSESLPVGKFPINNSVIKSTKIYF